MRLTTALKAAIPVLIISAGLAGCASTAGPVAVDCMNVPGAVIGGVAGGILGSQVGKGSGRDVAIGAGAATGAVVGSNVGC